MERGISGVPFAIRIRHHYFCDNFQRHIRMFRCILCCFEVVSSLRLNLGKSTLIVIGEVPNLDQLAADHECK